MISFQRSFAGLAFFSLFFMACQSDQTTTETKQGEISSLQTLTDFTVEEANQLASLPLYCLETAYPNKPGEILEGENDLVAPKVNHPIFYGCFDWHSSVHGYWSLVTLLRHYPNMERADEIRALLQRQLTAEKVLLEKAYFEKPINKSFERTYGWAWLLKLQTALDQWPDPEAQQWSENLRPLSDLIVERYKDFLPKLQHPIRVGEHPNTAFGLVFAYDYALAHGDEDFKKLIHQRGLEFYKEDKQCPIDWEPNGFDFLSPCLEEVDLMRRLLSEKEFASWLKAFLPALADGSIRLEVGQVSDRSDGKLVHLEGLNFSRAWVLFGLAQQYSEYAGLLPLAQKHYTTASKSLMGDDYMGSHWLGSFALYALENKQALAPVNK